MSDKSYEYIECNCCGTEERKLAPLMGGLGGAAWLTPENWLTVVNQDGKRMYDMCPECSKAFTVWFFKRANVLIDEEIANRKAAP